MNHIQQAQEKAVALLKENLSHTHFLTGEKVEPHLVIPALNIIIAQTIKATEERIVEGIEESKYVFEREKDYYLPEVYKHLKSKNEGKDDIINLINK